MVMNRYAIIYWKRTIGEDPLVSSWTYCRVKLLSYVHHLLICYYSTSTVEFRS